MTEPTDPPSTPGPATKLLRELRNAVLDKSVTTMLLERVDALLFPEATTLAQPSTPGTPQRESILAGVTPIADDGKIGCAARRAGTAAGNYPQDCDWPFCGCDERATKVVETLQECGWGPRPGTPKPKCPRCGSETFSVYNGFAKCGNPDCLHNHNLKMLPVAEFFAPTGEGKL